MAIFSNFQVFGCSSIWWCLVWILRKGGPICCPSIRLFVWWIPHDTDYAAHEGKAGTWQSHCVVMAKSIIVLHFLSHKVELLKHSTLIFLNSTMKVMCALREPQSGVFWSIPTSHVARELWLLQTSLLPSLNPPFQNGWMRQWMRKNGSKVWFGKFRSLQL